MKAFIENVIRPTFWLSLSCEKSMAEDECLQRLIRCMTLSARNISKLRKAGGRIDWDCHLVYWCDYDLQPNRVDDAWHFHLFVNVEGVGMSECSKIEERVLMGLVAGEWSLGDKWIERYDNQKWGPFYQHHGHSIPLTRVACSNGRKRCKMHDCWVSRNETHLKEHLGLLA